MDVIRRCRSSTIPLAGNCRRSFTTSSYKPGYLSNSRSLQLQPVHIAEPVLAYLKANDEEYVLRCIQVGP